jgi:hypothetical protein
MYSVYDRVKVIGSAERHFYNLYLIKKDLYLKYSDVQLFLGCVTIVATPLKLTG